MGLLEEIEETKAKLAEAIEAEDKPATEVVDEPVVEEPPVEQEEEKKEGPEEEKQDDEPVVENPTASDFARMRREKKAKEREAEELRRKVEELSRPREEPKPEPKVAVNADPEPDRATKYESWLEWKDRQLEKKVAYIEERVEQTTKQSENARLINAAVQEFQSYEQDFRAIIPEYDGAAEYYTRRLGDGIKMLYPDASAAQVGEMIRNKVLEKAAIYVKQGLDPAEELYNEAKSYGFAAKKPAEEQEEEARPNLSKVAANKARNAGTAGAGGRGSPPQITREMASRLTNAEWAKLTVTEKRRLMMG